MILSKPTATHHQQQQPAQVQKSSTSSSVSGRQRKRHSNGKLKDPLLQQSPSLQQRQQRQTTATGSSVPAATSTTKATTTTTINSNSTTKAPATKASAATKPKAKKKNPVHDQKPGVSSNWQRLQSQLAAKKAELKRKQSGRMITKKKTNQGKSTSASAVSSQQGVAPASVNGSASALNSKGDIWFDNVDSCLIKSSMLSTKNQSNIHVGTAYKLCKETSFDGLTRALAMDCEMVGAGYLGRTSILARVSIVNLYGHCIFDKFVKPTEEVTDYRTDVSGIRPENLANADDFKTVQSEVFALLLNRTLVGHAVHHDLKVLFLSHPKASIRDTSHYFKQHFNGRTPSLKKLTETYLGVQIQTGEHDSITDAQATMRLYTLFKKKWESELGKAAKLKQQRGKHTKQTEMVPLFNTSGTA